MYQYFFKRPLDFTAALLGLLILSPIFLIVTLALAIANNGKAFFFQQRPGEYEKVLDFRR